MTRIELARAAQRVVASVPLHTRLEACRSFGVDLEYWRDPIGAVVDGWRNPDGIDFVVRTAPIGVIGLIDPDPPQVAECLAAGNSVLVSGLDCTDICRTIVDHGLPSDAVVAVDEVPRVEIDALVKGDRVVMAERVGTHSHFYVDSTAPTGQVTYLAVNAAAAGAIDAVIVHRGYPGDAMRDLTEALGYSDGETEILRARSATAAIDMIDTRTAGRIEAIATSDISVARLFESRVDAQALAVNVSPAFVEDEHLSSSLRGFTRLRTVLRGDGQTRRR